MSAITGFKIQKAFSCNDLCLNLIYIKLVKATIISFDDQTVCVFVCSGSKLDFIGFIIIIMNEVGLM